MIHYRQFLLLLTMLLTATFGMSQTLIVKDSITNDNAIGIRYGGDEFLIIAANANRKYAEDIRKSIIAYIEKENSMGLSPVKFSVSIGYVLTDPRSDKSVIDYVDEADKLMYEIKNEYHRNNPSD